MLTFWLRNSIKLYYKEQSPRCSRKTDILKNFAKLTGKDLCQGHTETLVWDSGPRTLSLDPGVGPWGGTLEWDPGMGPQGVTLGWDPGVEPCGETLG